MKGTRTNPWLALATAAGLIAVTTALPTLSAAAATPASPTGVPTVKLIATQREVKLYSFRGQVFFDPAVYIASLDAALQFDVGRPSYTKPVTISQVIHSAAGTTSRPLPNWMLAGWNGLRHFLHVTIRTSAGQVIRREGLNFCPDSYDPSRVSPGGPMGSPYPYQCSPYEPFPKGMVWGVQRGWAVDPFEQAYQPIRLGAGIYQVTVKIGPRYRALLGITKADGAAHVKIKVVKIRKSAGQGSRAAAGPLPSLPRVPLLSDPPLDARPDLIPLPSWGISVQNTRPGRSYLDFGATVWIGGNSPLDVEGFRSGTSPIMKAYQYFWRNGRLIGRARAGTMGFDSQHGHNHWHFQQFARYQLLNSARAVAVRSHKVGFCIAPTNPVDLLIHRATWQPSFVGLEGQCGVPSALWVRERLPVGWGDTYVQSLAGQSFNITNLPNGVYYIEVIANPEHILYETNTRNDISLRKVILGGYGGHRTVRVPAWHGLNAEP